MTHSEHDFDDELAVMKIVAAALSSLGDEKARWRVLRWVIEHFAPPPDISLPAIPLMKHEGGFATLSDLFAAAEPKRERDKALVSAYWFQRQSPSGSFTAQEVNKGLKDLGSRVINITGALGDLAEQSPRLVAQLGKSGKSRQSRKTYRLTPAGMEAVQRMLKLETKN